MSGVFQFGPYELVHQLGAGGMAETFLAVRRGPGGFEQHVCVKRILPAMAADPTFLTQFLDEARIAARLRHKNIAQVVDFGEAAGSHYLALELVDGMDLRALYEAERARGRTLDPAIVVFLGLELTSALAFAHHPSHGVIHRDISPSNILVSRSGEVYLTDFGIARALGASRRTKSGVVRGKVPYMAQEYAVHAHFDARTDLFSVGVVLYEGLTGRRPYEGATDLETLALIKLGTFAPLASRVAVDARLGIIVDRLLRLNPEERFASADELHEALAALAPPPTVARQLAEIVRNSRPSLGRSLSGPTYPTDVLAGGPAPAYPVPDPSSPGELTRTRDGSAPTGAPMWASTNPDQLGGSDAPRASWNSTDPTAISHHDRPSPYAPKSSARGTSSSPSIETIPPRKSAMIALLAIVAVLAFVGATIAAYFLVSALRSGAI